ncbi:Beta-ketoadipate enol-lactone hydrolase [Leucobacter sp. 7(1)]|uniref:alpha/beta fold hydrolase n=1 Tax=Leucobacter sp. 7(1) TaxID=1255613 RepID=UPI00097F475B|nr:alpha/beta fold hydrolase [Leucobacter sp. 7(1)]SJN12152.1 Beta-ketoadipate enol-lactone hydrolase [Leucobacter sp. 7(1)]
MTPPQIALTEPAGTAGAPLVVLAHSLGTGPIIWERVVPELARDYRVTLLSLPGHGSAPAPADPFTIEELADAVAAAIRELEGTGVRYAGVSIGGALGLMLALRHPALFSGVASVASAASLGTAEHWAARALLVREQSTAALVTASAQAWFAPESIANEPEITGRILRELQAVSDEGYARCAEALGGFDVRSRLGEIAVPLLAMGGEFDTVAPEPRQDEIVAGVLRGRKVMIAGAAHQPPAEQAAAVTAALQEFFAEVGR